MIGIICAMQIEADGILELMQNKSCEKIAGMNFTKGNMHGKDVVVVVCGVGKVNAAMCALALVQSYNPDCIVNSGVAGSVSSKLKIGDIVIADKAVEHDMNATALGDEQGEVTFPDGNVIYFNCDKAVADSLYNACSFVTESAVERGVIASGDIFISERSQRLKIGERFSALACEMEGAAIAHVCFRTNTPCGILRAISDDLDENEGMDFVKFCELASKKTVGIIDNFVQTNSIDN